jgi:branched-subunit amino acid transport protein
MTAWIAVVCIGIGSLALRITPLAFAGRTTSPRTSRLIKDAGAAATAAITVASFDRAAQSGDVGALAVAGVVGFVLALRGASMLRVVVCGIATFVAVSMIL